MILPFDQAETLAEVVPLEFVSLDEPEQEDAAAPEEEETDWRARAEELEQRVIELERSARLALDAARHEAEAERIEATEESHRQTDELRQRIGAWLGEFAEERERYFADVEREVVQLALAIAERVLHREAAIDPLLLRSAVQLALERVAGRGRVRLQVAPGEAAAWRGALGTEVDDASVEVKEDDALSATDVVLETEVGRVDLGVREQLKEVERGFFDLLDKRPGRR